MARKKSIADIIRQRNRIQERLIKLADTSTTRYKIAGDAANKYVTNIRKKFGNDIGSDGRWNSVAYKRVSQRIYMGLSNG